MSYEAFAETVLVDERDEVLGEKSGAFVLAPARNLTAKDVRYYSRRLPSYYKTPDFVTFKEPLPRNFSGRILKRALASGETNPRRDSRSSCAPAAAGDVCAD